MARVLPPAPNQAPPPNPVVASKALPRGIRNQSPGNLDRTNPRTPWRGALPDDEYPHSHEARVNGGRFEVFIAPQWGIRALVVVLLTYQRKHGLRTIESILNRWAPPVENNTKAYVAAVAQKVGVGPRDDIDLGNATLLRPLVEAIIAHENAGYRYPDDLIREGLRLAGVEEAQTVAKTPAVRSAGMAAAPVVIAGGASAAVGLLGELAPHLGTISQISAMVGSNGLAVAAVMGGLALMGFAWAYMKRSARREETGT